MTLHFPFLHSIIIVVIIPMHSFNCGVEYSLVSRFGPSKTKTFRVHFALWGWNVRPSLKLPLSLYTLDLYEWMLFP